MRISIPIVSDMRRVNCGFLRSALKSLFENSSVEHDVVIVSNDGDDPAFIEVVKPWPVRTVHVPGPFVIEGIGNRLYEYLNIGARHAKTEWLLSPAGDDSYFFPNWECLLEHVSGHTAIWTPYLLETFPHHSHVVETPRQAEVRVGWIEGQKMKESELLKFLGLCQDVGLLHEMPHDRTRAHWANTVQHRDTYSLVGGYRETPPYPDSHDLHLHDAYSQLGVKKVCVTGSVIGNCRAPIEVGS